MAIFENLTPYSAGEVVTHGADGSDLYTVAVKATYDIKGKELVLASEQVPVVSGAVYTGDPAVSGLALETDLAPVKKRVDVILAGALKLPTPVAEADVTLVVGREVRKALRVTGDRYWIVGVMRALTPSKPVPWIRMPIAWERAFGGTDPDDPAITERHNPVGCGMHRRSESLDGKLLPNFEDPRELVTAWDSRAVPQGFGPVASHWSPRVALGGTYDEKWRARRAPLLPLDFDPYFYNAAPADQQLARYVPGTEIRLGHMTEQVHERFLLPALVVPVVFADRRGSTTRAEITPDTIIIAPETRQVHLVGRRSFAPKPDVSGLGVIIGQASKGRIRAMQTGKQFIGR